MTPPSASSYLVSSSVRDIFLSLSALKTPKKSVNRQKHKYYGDSCFSRPGQATESVKQKRHAPQCKRKAAPRGLKRNRGILMNRLEE